ncbi:unnamed protein product [Rotaria sp. Silwood1]|nr:unnamed protein product [Rotaria sp. Silwood1]
MVSCHRSNTQRYDLKYRRKIQFRRTISKTFDREFKAKQNARQRKCRQRKKEAQRETTIALASPATKRDSRKAEGIKRRRANIRKLKNENEKLLDKIQQLQNENLKMKRLLSQQHLEKINTVDTTSIMSTAKLFTNNVSPPAKKRATKRLLNKKKESTSWFYFKIEKKIRCKFI